MGEEYKRPSWDDYFMQLAMIVGSRGTCDRGRCGAIIVKDKRILATGYVGSPIGLPHCDEVGHLFKQVTHEDGSVTQHCLRTLHAEQNAIIQAARSGINISDGELYVKFTPCYNCAKMIINAGIKRVVCYKHYHAGAESVELLKSAGVKVEFVTDDLEEYEGQRIK